MNAPDLSIIIVNWNVRDLLDLCLGSIKHYTGGISYEVIVVDSASSDDSVEMVKQKYPWVRLMAMKQNVGFTKGNNIGLKEATGKHILYLNPDIELIEDAIPPMLSYLEQHPAVGAIGCALLNTDKTHQNSIGTYLRLSSLIREYYLREKAETVNIDHPGTPTTVEVVLGACLLVPGHLAQKIGGFDERYFMYQEETDMCLSLKHLGFSTVYYPDTKMIHHGSKSATKSAESRQRTLHENRKSQYLFIAKHYGSLAGFMAKFLIGTAMLLRIPILAIKHLVKPDSDARIKAGYYLRTVSWLLRTW